MEDESAGRRRSVLRRAGERRGADGCRVRFDEAEDEEDYEMVETGIGGRGRSLARPALGAS